MRHARKSSRPTRATRHRPCRAKLCDITRQPVWQLLLSSPGCIRTRTELLTTTNRLEALRRCQRCVWFFRPASIVTVTLRLGDPLRLSAASVVIVFAGDGGQHVEQHGVDGCEHAGRELIGGRRQLPACRQVERDYADLLGVEFRAELPPVGIGQARQPIDLLDQQDIPRLPSANRRNSSGRASFAPNSFSM